jgi:hypothetical protein
MMIRTSFTPLRLRSVRPWIFSRTRFMLFAEGHRCG